MYGILSQANPGAQFNVSGLPVEDTNLLNAAMDTESLFAVCRSSLIEVHAVATGLLILHHLEIFCRKTKGLQYTIAKLLPISLSLVLE